MSFTPAPATKFLTPIDISTAFYAYAGLNPSDYAVYNIYAIIVSNSITNRESLVNEVQNAFYPIDDYGPPPAPGVLLFWAELKTKALVIKHPKRLQHTSSEVVS